MFVWEKIPLAVTSMIVCLALILFKVLEPSAAFAGFVNNNVILFVAMFVVGGALFETGMANKIGGVVTKFAKTERQLIVAVMVITGLMSGVLSNTGTAAVLIPVVIGIAAKSGFARSRLLMPLVFAAAMGGNLSLIGAPGNLIAQSALQEMNMQFGFFEYAKIGLPILVVGIIYFAFIGYKFLPKTQGDPDSVFNEVIDYSHVPAWKQTLSLLILVVTIIGMIFEEQIGIKLHVTGSIGALLLVLTGVMTEKEAYKSIDLNVIFLFGGTLALASALDKTGAGALIAETVMGALGQNASPFVLLFAIFMIAAVLTNFMSNTATTALLVPISVSIASGMGADPRAVLMATVIGGSLAYATPIGMPANTMVLAAGGYRFMDYVKAGLPLIVVATIVSMILLPIFFPFFPA
jgi:anion transporter